MNSSSSEQPTVYSIGHGSRICSEFVSLLVAVGVVCLVDVRSYPSSKRYPQFTRIALEPALKAEHIRYLWEGEALGGMRRPDPKSPHVALTDPTLRGYADYMEGAEFNGGIERLALAARSETLAFTCAEKEPLHCHRSFIADALLLRGVRVLHLHGTGDVRQHVMRPEARTNGNVSIVYDSGVQLGFGL